jgi:hypothetical protein
MKRKHILILTGSLAGIGMIALLVIRNKKKKEVTDILDKLDKGTNETGTIADLGGDEAFNVNLANDRKKIPAGSPLLRVATAQDYAKKVYDKFGYVYDDEEGAISLLSQIGTKVKVSQVAKEFGIKYGTDMGQFLTSKIDKSNNPDTLKRIIANMKLY